MFKILVLPLSILTVWLYYLPCLTSCKELTHWKRLWCWEGLRVGGKGDNRGWDGWMASPTRWMWVWVNSGSWWWTGRPGMLQFMGSQRVGHDWVTELNWMELNLIFLIFKLDSNSVYLKNGVMSDKCWAHSKTSISVSCNNKTKFSTISTCLWMGAPLGVLSARLTWYLKYWSIQTTTQFRPLATGARGRAKSQT